MLKGMLRNPEVATNTCGIILDLVSIDLSKYSADLMKPFGQQLHSNNDTAREESLEAVTALGKQCSEADAIGNMLTAIFKILNGSEGKLTNNAHKASLFQAVGRLADNKLSPSAVCTVAEIALENLIKSLGTEAHEGSLVEALATLNAWMKKFRQGQISAKFVEWVGKALAMKTSTTLVKSAYLRCVFTALEQGEGSKFQPLVPALNKIVESAVKQPLLFALVAESAHAVACLLKMSDSLDGAKLTDLLKIVNESSLFINERFLVTISAAVMESLVFISSFILMSPENLNTPNINGWHKIITLGLTFDDSKTRKVSQICTKKVVSMLGGGKIIVSILQEFDTLFWKTPTIQLISDNAGDGGPPGDVGASGTAATKIYEIKSAHVVRALIFLSSCVKLDSAESREVAMAMIRPAHHPLVDATRNHLWTILVQKLSMETSKVIEAGISPILDILIGLIKDNKATADLAVGELSRLNPNVMVPNVVSKFNDKMKVHDLHVSLEDYEIYLSPEGKVADDSFMENLTKENAADLMNVKRESKAYSYKEQLEEIALRKEIEEKKKREGKWKEPKLTPKQKELLANQLEKESAIRKKIQEVVADIDPYINMLLASVKGNPKAFMSLIGEGEMMETIYQTIVSPVAADKMIELLRGLRKSIFVDDKDESLGQNVVAMLLQVLKPASKKFTTEDLINKKDIKGCLAETIDTIYKASVVQDSNHDKYDGTCPFPASAITFMFPLIRKAMLLHRKEEEEGVITKCLKIIIQHVGFRGIDDKCLDIMEIDEFHPRYLPTAKLLKLMIEVISSTGGQTQQLAVLGLVETAAALAGGVGCSTMTDEELEFILDGLQMEVASVRDACLRSLITVHNVLEDCSNLELRQRIIQRVWVAKFDVEPENRKLANDLWDKVGLEPFSGLSVLVLSDIVHPIACIRLSGAEAMAHLLENVEKDSADSILVMLLDIYEDKLVMSPPVVDSLGRVIERAVDHWEPRSGVALAVGKISQHISNDMVIKVVKFFVQEGLGDREETVRTKMLDAAVQIVNLHGKANAGELLPVFEEFLENAPKTETYDNIRQAVVILMGSLAKHLEPEDPKVRPIIRQLIIALKTPSQQVQESVANCLPPLVPAIKEQAPDIISNLITTLLGDTGYGERKGAAYGIAGLVKGLGILSLKQLDIMGKLTEAITNKKQPAHREGALFAFEMLCNMLGRLFEPYIVHILPHLLLCFGDPVEHVRQAADETAKAVMSKLSAHGVKLILPALLNALEEDQWRTKTGSVELLGAMAFCAPKQLSSCLPSIVPKIIEVLGDSHPRVQAAAAQALKQIASVIKNPEIQAIVSILLKALRDPAQRTGKCLQTLLDTKFVHFIDAPSLALIMPVVQRAFQDRSTETRKMAAQIIGNMYSLTDQKDLGPYLPGIVPGLKSSLLDPVPEVRTVSARALGAMVKGMGEASFEDLLPWLMTTLTSETSSVDRSGAAQGLAEVIGGLGVEKMNALLPDIVKTAERPDIAPHVKDGYIMMFIYMPSVFPEEFTQYISRIIVPILRALSDENEYVRETAYKAGQRLVLGYAEKAISLLLPELEKGLFDDNWRIRYSSIQLLGKLISFN